MNTSVVLEVDRLTVGIRLEGRRLRPVDDISFALERGRTVGLVGESGCGKSMTALAILRLMPKVASIESGAIRFEGRDLVQAHEAEIRAVRGNGIAMVFQEPMTSLNPVYPCGEQVAEVLRLHRGLDRPTAWARAVELLEGVHIPDPARRARAYPHQLSGGMRQRVMIAMAIACDPAVLIADEPTTALDVTIQRQILDLLDELQSRLGMSVLHITHDLAVVGETAHEILVMYAGRIVEQAPARELFERPAHPYTLGLLASRPELGARQERLPALGGQVPEPTVWTGGCRFTERCPFAVERCHEQEPPLEPMADSRRVRCWEATRVQEAGAWPR
jgi:oligopeptide/dipeptide ABC transporter ATP-binding protein